ncbi:MAG: hypothetical protein N2C14_02365 [Planctomycetales bacterium]
MDTITDRSRKPGNEIAARNKKRRPPTSYYELKTGTAPKTRPACMLKLQADAEGVIGMRGL